MRSVVPAGFALVPSDRDTLILVREDCARLVRGMDLSDPEALLRADRPHESSPEGSAGELEGADPSAGHDQGVRGPARGRVVRISGSGGEALVLKKYRRGGALAALLPDLFLRRRRMLGDLEASQRARSHGVPSAPAACLILKRRLGLLWEGYLLSEEIHGAVTLAGALARAPRERALQLARSAVLSVRRLHDAGVVHRDLNLGNLLVRDEDVYVIDLDGARIEQEQDGRASSLTPALRFAGLSRLDRSYVKLFREGGPLAHEDRHGMLHDYCGDDGDLRRELESRLARHKRSLRLHALLWGRPAAEPRGR